MRPSDASAPRKRLVLSRRELLRRSAILGASLSLSLLACQPAPSAPAKPAESKPAETKPAAPAATTAPAAPVAASKPTEAPKPAEKPAQAAPAATTAPAPAAAAKPAEAAKPAGNVKRGGIFKVQDTGLAHLDTSTQAVASVQWVTWCVYDPLVEYRDNDYNDIALVPKLAESWSTSPDGATVTLNLRKGVKWQNIAPVNGREFTSADVAWNAEYYKTTASAKFLWEPVEKVETPDPYTAVIKLKEPAANFIPSLAHKFNPMFPREVFDQKGNFKELAIGTGPMIVKQFIPGEKVIMEARKDYWQVSEIDGKPLPYLDGLESYTLTDYNARVAGMRAGQFDQYYTLGGPLWSDANALKQQGLDVQRGVDIFNKGLVLNQEDPLWKDARVRQAVAFAVDRQGFIETQYEGNGEMHDFVSSAQGWGWDMETIKKRLARDVPKARQLLEAAGKMGEKLTISGYTAGPAGQNQKAAAFLADNLKEAGFNVELDFVPDYPTFLASRIQPGKFQSMVLVFGSGADPNDYLYGPYFSTQPPTTNYARVKDPKLDEMILAQRREIDETKRRKLVLDLNEYLYQQMYYIPTAHAFIASVRQSWVRMKPMHFSDRPVGLERAWLDK